MPDLWPGEHPFPITLRGSQVTGLRREGDLAILRCRESGDVLRIDRAGIAQAALALGLKVVDADVMLCPCDECWGKREAR